MIYYRMLWFAALLTGLANLLMFVAGFGSPCLLAAIVVGVVCAITYHKEKK